MSAVVLDASAVIAVLRDEPGAAVVSGALDGAAISAVNVQEVFKALLRRGILLEAAQQMMMTLRLDIHAHRYEDAVIAASLWSATEHLGSGIGDRTAMALAVALQRPVITTDRAWAALKIDGLTVILAR